jgi:hypothetical protein
MKLNLKEQCAKKTITREDGGLIYKIISEAWNSESKIVIDFSNILIASVSFFDEAFGKLAFDHSLEDLKNRLSFENMEHYDRALLNDILISRYHQKEKGQNGVTRIKRKTKNRATA